MGWLNDAHRRLAGLLQEVDRLLRRPEPEVAPVPVPVPAKPQSPRRRRRRS